MFVHFHLKVSFRLMESCQFFKKKARSVSIHCLNIFYEIFVAWNSLPTFYRTWSFPALSLWLLSHSYMFRFHFFFKFLLLKREQTMSSGMSSLNNMLDIFPGRRRSTSDPDEVHINPISCMEWTCNCIMVTITPSLLILLSYNRGLVLSLTDSYLALIQLMCCSKLDDFTVTRCGQFLIFGCGYVFCTIDKFYFWVQV
jgi:hypothetical protein